ncbi:hypothetical protein [Actinoplanes sp. HUAS TT8]|uniref:hypothetical protein n=1 Tax=Actinoplanes sp. HUAS TT8 TaxID=3447453 RepID=UPI003F52078C
MSRPSVRVRAPVVVRYDRPDWVPQLLADPAGPGLGAPEVWRYYVPRLDDQQVARTAFPVPHPTAFQPNHGRFYAVTTDLTADTADALRVSLVVRRERYEVVPGASLIRLARQIAVDPGRRIDGRDLRDLVEAEAFIPAGLRLRYRRLMRRRGARRRRQAWLDPVGWWPISPVWQRREIPGEREYPMWRRTDPVRRQWFGNLPTDAPFREPGDADPAWTYRVHCVVRWTPPAGRPFCPPGLWVSGPGAPMRIATLRMPATDP